MSKYTRRNYYEALDKIIPEIYREEDLKLSTESEDLASKILYYDADMVIRFLPINKLLYKFCTDPVYEDVLELGPWNTTDYLDRTIYGPGLGVYHGWSEGLVKYFIPQNKLTYIEPHEFSLEILQPLGYEISDYSTSSEFYNFVSGTLYPQLQLGDGHLGSETERELVSNTDGAFGSSYVDCLKYLLNSLGLFALLNYNGNTPPADESDYIKIIRGLVAEVFTKRFYIEESPVTLEDALYVIKSINQSVGGILPYAYSNEFRKDDTDPYLSGTQSLDKYLTWNSILYGLSENELSDTFVKDFYISYFVDKDYELPTTQEGPFKRFLKAVGFFIGDLDNESFSISTLNSIEKCPKKYLPYLADFIGWKFYTSNVDSWRRQLRDARVLLQKKGTKQGLIDLLKSILPATEIDFDKSFSEYYESYIPNLIYYLLKTESDSLQSLETWTIDKYSEYTEGEYDPISLDTNIKFVVDHILLDAVHEFPELFNIKGYAFQPDNPAFVFNYRGRDFNIPPFEDERFYKDCDVTYDLVRFIKEKLLCLGVEDTYCDAFEAYVLSNTIERDLDPKLYNNGFLFLTKTLHQAPNYDRIIKDFQSNFYDYLPMWNGKSSRFSLEVSSGNFDDSFFTATAYSKEDFFDSLKAIQDFTPAKSIPRIDISLKAPDVIDPYTNTYPRISYSFLDSPNPSGALASFELSTLNMRHPSLGLVGSSIDPGYEYDSRGTNNYSSLPVFKRDRLGFGRESTNAAWVDTSTVYNVSGPYEEVIPRTATRRRDFQKVLSKGQFFRRDGFNSPTFLNTTTVGKASTLNSLGEFSSLAEFIPLGLIPSSQEYTAVPDHRNIPDVYDECQDTDSNDVFNDIRSKYTFKIRGDRDAYNPPKDSSLMNNLVFKYRDNLEDVYSLIYKLKDREISEKARLTVENNIHLATNIDWMKEIESLKNKLWNETNYLLEEGFYNFKMDVYERVPAEINKTFNYLYLNDYVKYGKGLVSNAALDDYLYGGSTLVSHIYGPIFFNGLNKLDGSSVGKVSASTDDRNNTVFDRNSITINNKIKSIDQDFEFLARFCDTDLLDNYMQVGVAPESYTPYFISGVDIITWRNSNSNKIMLYDLSSDEGFLDKDSLLLDGNLICLKAKEYLPRFRYTFNYKEAGDEDNFLRPEHNYSVEVSSLFLEEDSFKTSSRSVSVWIHTEEETDYYGRKVFWNYMPNGQWEMLFTSSLQGQDGISYVRNSLSHIFSHQSKDIESLDNIRSCYVDDVNREVLYSLGKEDLISNKVSFNTLNRKIKIPIEYYQYKNQLHRKDQKYVIEVFPSLSQDDSEFWAFKGIRCTDDTMKKRASIRFNHSIPDYSLSKTDTDKEIELFYPDGNPVSLGSLIYIDREGSFYKDNIPLTVSVSKSGKRILYSKLFVGSEEFPTSQSIQPNATSFFRPYEGYAVFAGYTKDSFIQDNLGDFTYIISKNTIQDYTLQNYGSSQSDMLPALKVQLPFKVDYGTFGCRYEGLSGTAFDFDNTDVYNWSNPDIVTLSSNIIGPLNLPLVTLSSNNIQTEFSPVTTRNNYIRNTLWSDELYNNQQLSVNPEDLANYISEPDPETCTFGSTDTSGYLDTTHPLAAIDHWNTWTFNEIPYNSKYPHYLTKNIVYYEGPKDIIFTLIYKPSEELPQFSKVFLEFGLGGLSPQHSHNRVFGLEVNEGTLNQQAYWSFKPPLGSTGELNHRATFPFRKKPYDPTIHFFNQIRPFYLKGYTDIQGYPDIPAGYGGVYELNSEYRLAFISLKPSVLQQYSQLEDPSIAKEVAYIKSSLGAPAKIAVGIENNIFQPGEVPASIDVAYIGIHKDDTPEDYTYPLTYFTQPAYRNSVIGGSELGSLIKKEISTEELMDPDILLSFFRFYNDISDETQSRNPLNVQTIHGDMGGGRSNYRIHPAEFSDQTAFLNEGRIDNLNIIN